jgi:hypothetical protein
MLPLCRLLFVRRSPRRAQSSRRWFRPHFLELEDRTVPSVLTVTNFSDHDTGSLRQELGLAQIGDLLNFDPSLGPGTITLTTGVLTINNSITIAGPGADKVTVSGNDASQVFSIYPVSTVTPSVTISGLTIAHGRDSTHNAGGGIENSGTLTLNNCTLSNNVVAGTSVGEGGAIANFATLNVSGCTFSGNSVTASGSQPETGGGAIFNGGYPGVAAATIRNSTFSGNTVSGNTYFNVGGAIETWSDYGGASLTIVNCTFSGNSAFRGGGIASETAGDTHTTQLLNTIVAGNTAAGDAPDVYSWTQAGSTPLQSLGHNLIGVVDTSSSGWVASDLTGTAAAPLDPGLGPLADNGGPTQTMALLLGSPAIAAADPNGAPSTDQRGVSRSSTPSIGAYEYVAQAVVDHFQITVSASATAGTAVSVTITALDANGQPVTGYTGTVHFTSTDPSAMLPDDYTFTAADAGTHVFTAGATFFTAGNQTISATDTADATITGSASLTVNPAAADHLVFLQQPSDTAAGQTISPGVVVAVVDAFGNVETGDNNDTVTLSLSSNPSGGTLRGTLTMTVTNGVATFSDLSIDLPGMGYTMNATVGGSLPDADSDAFTIM